MTASTYGLAEYGASPYGGPGPVDPTMNPSITQARELLAAILSALDGLTVRARGPVKAPRAGDGWVTVGEVSPAGYRSCHAALTAFISVGADLARAEDLADQWSVPVLNAAMQAFACADVTVRREEVVTGESSTGPTFAIVLSLTLEVS